MVRNERIMRNTILMYIRMFITMGVSLYTSRFVLKALGVVDFGIFNVVGGLVTLLAFMNNGMLVATQRFLNYEIGRNNPRALSEVFKTAYLIHVFIVILIIVMGECFGGYILYHKLMILDARMYAASIVLQVSIMICAVQILALPFLSVIVAHEKMDIYAYISILECFLKLCVAFAINLSEGDHLIEYVYLLGIVQLLIAMITVSYCWSHFKEVRGRLRIYKDRLKEMGVFASWCLIGCAAAAFANQGLNVMLGMFFSPAINAARGIAVQVQSAIISFGGNLNTVMAPQITQSYASGDLNFFFNILYRGSKYVFFLMAVLSVPVLLRTEYIIGLWLGEIPDSTVVFLRWLICTAMMEAISYPLMRASDASGRIKVYHSVVGGVLLLILPISYVTLRLGGDPVSVFVVNFIINLMAWGARLLILRTTVGLSVRKYIRNVFIKVISIFVLANVLGYFVTCRLPQDLWGLLSTCVITTLISGVLIYFMGLDDVEKSFMKMRIFKLLH